MTKTTILPIALFLSLISCQFSQAQTNDIRYQGSLTTAGVASNGNHDFEFALFDSVAGGTQQGSTVSLANVVVTSGLFSVQLNFGENFPGANRFLEIRVRQSGGGAYTTLNPRQAVTSSPYSIRSLNAGTADTAASAGSATSFTGNLLGDVLGTQGATRVNLVGGQTSASVANAALAVNSATQANIPNTLVMRNVNGDFSASTIFATQQYNINANRVLGINGSNNIFVGVNAGFSNTTGNSNAFFGSSAGQANTTGNDNSFFGRNAGASNTDGINNSFFGRNAGTNTTGNGNSFFGKSAGESNMGGGANSFFGAGAGESNTTGGSNSFFGRDAGQANTTGDENSFFGRFAGNANVSGTNNSFFGRFAGNVNTTGDNNTIIGNGADVGSGDLSFATAIGASAVVSTSNTVVLGRTDDIVRIPGFLRVVQLGSPGSTPLCQNVNDTISTCSSSIRYKSNISVFSSGLSLIKQLRPVSFNWIDGGMLDMGLVAEEVSEVEPLLVTTNKKGEVEGVKYDRVGVVLINAVNEQQAQIESQQKQIDEQNQLIRSQKEELDRQGTELEALKTLVCSQNPTAAMCKSKEQ